jgi:hypothetical protein
MTPVDLFFTTELSPSRTGLQCSIVIGDHLGEVSPELSPRIWIKNHECHDLNLCEYYDIHHSIDGPQDIIMFISENYETLMRSWRGEQSTKNFLDSLKMNTLTQG